MTDHLEHKKADFYVVAGSLNAEICGRNTKVCKYKMCLKTPAETSKTEGLKGL